MFLWVCAIVIALSLAATVATLLRSRPTDAAPTDRP
jgi:hypothetical protein